MFFRYLIKRLGQTVVVLFSVTLLSFVLVRMAPGNPARMLLPDDATETQVAEMEHELGLDQPLYMQYLKYIGGALRGDLGMSITYRTPVSSIIGKRLPATIQLTAASILVSLLISIPIGIIAGARQGSILDLGAMTFALIGQSMSTVWLAVLNIFVFAVWLGWLPALGYGGIKYFILPAVTLGYPVAAQVTRLGRSGMIDVLREDFITATLAKGIPAHVIYTKYAFKNALIPIVTVVGMQVGYYLGGAIVSETIFAWPGIGQLLNQSVGNRDYPMVQSLLLVSAIIIAIINFLVDIINSLIDPRITFE
jgi:peptide/nickel transport system permease protein